MISPPFPKSRKSGAAVFGERERKIKTKGRPAPEKVPTLRKERERIDWIRAKARFELSMLLVRTKTAGQKGAFAHDDYRM